MKTPLTSLFSNSYLALIYCLLYTPILILIIFSFNDATYSLLWHGFTLKWYKALHLNHDLWLAALHSLMLAVSVATVATLLGTLAAINLYRYRFLGRKFSHGLIFVLLIVPDIMLGLSLLLLFNTMQLQLGFFSLLLAHITLCLPFVTVTIYSALRGIDKNIFEAAIDLGATESIIIRKIIMPLLWPALLASWPLSFTLSLDDVMISYFVSGPSFDILPLKIYSLARLGTRPDLNAICTIIFLLTLFFVLIAHVMLNRNHKAVKDIT